MKKKLLIIIPILVLIIGIILAVLLFFQREEDNNLKPYVEKENIEVSKSNSFNIPFKPYAKNTTTKDPVDLDGISFEDTVGSYKFSNYKESEPDKDNYVTYSFQYDTVVPLKYTVDNSKVKSNWSRSYAFMSGVLFDYYTGDVYKLKTVTVSGTIRYFDYIDTDEENMAYTSITWNDKTYKIGVRVELSSKWDGIKKISSSNNIDTYTDTNRITSIVYVYAPKDYDGIMIALNKRGTSKEMVDEEIKANKRYNELLEEYNKTGKKSDELIEVEKQYKDTDKLLDTYIGNNKNDKDSFYVLRVNNIEKAK